MRHRPILLVEDNDDDAELTFMAFAEAKLGNPMVRVCDGVEALEYLAAATAGAHPLPIVVLLDINLPRLSGIEVLKRLRQTPQIAHLPVVILTSSDDEQDRMNAYLHHANSYVRKPVDYDQFVRASRELGLYWTVTNRPPPQRAQE